LIGSGSFGCVFLALDLERNRQVAIKRSFKVSNMLSREFEILSEAAECENCVKLLDIFYTVNEEQRFIQNLVFEYLPENLLRYMQRQAKEGGIAHTKIREIMRQILKALEFLHAKQIMHRDLKPENILIADTLTSFKVKLCDFGSAKRVSEKSTPYIVSRYYRAPELIFCNSEYDCAIDIWSAACIWVELFTNTVLFTGKDEGDQFIKQAEVLGPPSISDLAKLFCSSDLDPKVMNKCRSIGSKVSLETFVMRDPQHQQLVDLLEGMLAWDAAARPSASDCLAHPYFAE
jgi:glycogen synthase kinase 3 beta